MGEEVKGKGKPKKEARGRNSGSVGRAGAASLVLMVTRCLNRCLPPLPDWASSQSFK